MLLDRPHPLLDLVQGRRAHGRGRRTRSGEVVCGHGSGQRDQVAEGGRGAHEVLKGVPPGGVRFDVDPTGQRRGFA